MDLERWLWEHLADWIEGVPGEETARRLEAAPPDAVPDDLWTYLAPGLALARSPGLRARGAGRTGAAILEERRQTSAALEAGRALEARGVGHVFFKGADLRHRVYPEPHRRDSQDLDVLCAAQDAAGALEALRAAGFRAEGDVGAVLDGRAHEVALRSGEAVVDLHVGPVQPGRTRFDAAAVVRDRTTIAIDGGALAVASPGDAVALCLVHVGVHEGAGEHVAFKHGLDLALAFRRWPDLDWSVVGGRLARWRCRRLAGAGLWTWEPRLGDAIPGDALAAIDPGAIQRALARRARLAPGPARRRASGARRLAQLARKFLYAEGWPERTWLLAELLRRAAPARQAPPPTP